MVLTRYRLFSKIHIFTFLIHKLVFGFFPIQLKKLYLSPGGQLKARGVRRDICRQIHVSTLSFNSALKKKKKKFKSSTEPRPEPRSQHREGDEKETELPGFCYGNTTGTNHTQNCKTNI